MSTYTGLVTLQSRCVDPELGDMTRPFVRRMSISFPFPRGHIVRPPPSPLPSWHTSQMSPLYSGGGGGWRNWVDPSSSSSSTSIGPFDGDYVRESMGAHDLASDDDEDDPEIEVEMPSSFLALVPNTPVVEDQESVAASPEREDILGTVP